MNFDRFAPDYGILPSAYFKKSAISNPIELFWSEELLSLLRLCGEREESIGARASDYDRFCALCRSLPLLEGHPMRAWIASVLNKYFCIQELPSEEAAAEAWKNLCESLLQTPIAPSDLVSGAWLCDSLCVPDGLPKEIEPVLHANLLLTLNVASATAWSEEIGKVASHFAMRGCRKIVLQIPDDFVFVTPSRYHADRALTSRKRDRGVEHLLICQLARELCITAQENDFLLVFVCRNHSAELAHLLEYAEQSVGLPRICWSVRDAKEAQMLLDFSARAHENAIFASIPFESVMTEAELLEALRAYQMRYPIGRLGFLTARDLRYTSFAQASVEHMLENCKTKI